VITYTVELGDNLFAIADKFGLKPETVLWGNFTILKDNPEILQPKQVLNILPVDGAYYQWQEGDNLDNVASFFKVKPEDIINYPGNHIDLTTIAKGEPSFAIQKRVEVARQIQRERFQIGVKRSPEMTAN
jgi:hypothetical protein